MLRDLTLHRILPKQAPVLFSGNRYRKLILGLNPLAYWPLNELSGTTAKNYGSLGSAANGSYTGCTLGQMAAPGGGLAPLFDGANDFVNVYSTSLRDIFNGALGTLAIWWKVYDAAVWTDGAFRRLFALAANYSTDYVTFSKPNTNNVLQYSRVGSSVNDWVSQSISNLSWNLAAITWDTGADQLKAYWNGAQTGATQTTLGTWVGLLMVGGCCIGTRDVTGSFPWNGYLSHAAIWNRALALAEIDAMYKGGL